MQQTPTIPYMPPTPEPPVVVKYNWTGTVIASAVALLVLLASIFLYVSVRHDLNAAKTELTSTKSQLSTTQSSLKHAQGQLAATENQLTTAKADVQLCQDAMTGITSFVQSLVANQPVSESTKRVTASEITACQAA